ncbi:MAG: aspartate kinase [SAR202 cluster bacterium]|nr:aspartate kinase [SAR202 cluster bacterium]
MSLIVQKYGGSSLKTPNDIQRVANRILKKKNEGNDLIVTVSAMGDTTDDLLDLANQVADRPNPRDLDVLLSTGELVSCSLLAIALNNLGVDAVSLSGFQAGVMTDDTHGRARITNVVSDRIEKEISNGRVVVVAGFQGITENFDITTLGRQSSDITAVAMAASLGASFCEIYSDVDGIYTADPRLVTTAVKLDNIGYDEMLELASYGAKMAPRSIEMGMNHQVRIVVASTFNENKGTLITKESELGNNIGEIQNKVRGIASDTNVAKVSVLGLEPGFTTSAELFEKLAQADISVDVIVQNTGGAGKSDITFTVKRTDLYKSLDIVNQVKESIGAEKILSSSNVAKVTIVGAGMQDAPGYAAKMFRAISDQGINIETITTSEIRITCIIDESRLKDAVKALHSTFELEK